MASLNILIITTPIVIAFGISFWLMIFLNTYRHFPKMNKENMIWMSIVNATVLTLILIGLVYLALWFILGNFIQ